MPYPAAQTPEPRDYRRALGQFPTGVTVITGRAPTGRALGLTVNSFASVSLEPPLVSWSLRTRSTLFSAFCGTQRFAVNVLGASQAAIASRFASVCEDRFAGTEVLAGIDDLPLLKGCIAWFECMRVACHIEGDHGVFIGRVERYASASTAAAPLVFYKGTYMTTQMSAAECP